jgi:hypothetical protein
MILHDLFEGRMKDIDIEYQDFLRSRGRNAMTDKQFQQAYGMTRTEWAKKNREWTQQKERRPVAPDAHLFHEGAMKDLHTELAEKYHELAPSIEKYKDSFLAGQLYDALEAIAIEHGAELEFKRMMTGSRNRAHMDYDTNPGGFQNWFWYLPFADGEQDLAEGAEDYAGIYSPEAIALGKKFCEFYNVTDDIDVQMTVEIIDNYIGQFKRRGQPIDLKVIKSGVVNAFRQVYRGMGPGPNFRKKFQNRLDEKDITEESQDDRNARIIAGEIEDARNEGNEKVAQEKIKRLTQLGYYFDKQGRLQRMGMYEEEVAEGFNDVAQMVFNGIAMYGFFRLLFRWFKNKALSADERLGLNRELSSGRNRVYKVYIDGKDVSSKILTKNEAFEVIKSMAKETHNPNTYFTIYNTDTKEVEFRHNVGTGESMDEQYVLEQDLQEKQDACYHKVKSRYKVWPSAYASGALVQCRKKGAANWGNKSKK